MHPLPQREATFTLCMAHMYLILRVLSYPTIQEWARTAGGFAAVALHY